MNISNNINLYHIIMKMYNNTNIDLTYLIKKNY